MLRQMLSDAEGGSVVNRAMQMQTNGGLQDIDDKTVREQLLVRVAALQRERAPSPNSPICRSVLRNTSMMHPAAT